MMLIDLFIWADSIPLKLSKLSKNYSKIDSKELYMMPIKRINYVSVL